MATPHRIAAALCTAFLAHAVAAATQQPAPQPAPPPSQQSAPEAGDSLRGAKVYRQFCQHCHGPNLVNPGTVSYDLRRLQLDEYPRFSASVLNGKGNMPPWKATLKDGDLPALWAYIMNNRGN